MAAWQAVFRPPGRILAILGHSPIAIIEIPSILDHGNKTWWDHLGHQEKMAHIYNGRGPGRNNGEAAVLPFCRKAENTPKI